MFLKVLWVAALAALVFSSPLKAEMRAFTNDSGYVIQAELLSHKEGKITLRRSDGKEFEADPAIFSAEDEAYIKAWMEKTPASQNYNLRLSTQKKKVEGRTRNMGYKRVKNDLWSYVITILNNSQDAVSNLTIKYRVFYTNAADGDYSASSYGESPSRMIEGQAKLEAELAFNCKLEITTTPVQIDVVDYDGAGSRYKDELRGCLVRIINQAGDVVLDWVSPEVAMKDKTWRNTDPSSRGKGGSVRIR